MQRKTLRSLYDSLETKLRALEILGVTRDKYASMLFPLVESALPEETLLAWERYRSTSRKSHSEGDQNAVKSTTGSDLDLILDFLKDEVQAEEHIILASQDFRVEMKPNFKLFKGNRAVKNKHKYGDAGQIASAADLFASSKEQKQCIFCQSFHNSTDCLKVRKMPMEDRENIVGKSGCCFLCLKPGHQVRKCFSKATCLGCGKRHHILLCHKMRQRTISPVGKETVELDNAPNGDQALANMSKSPSVMLQTLMVIIRGDNGKRRKVRAIIDSASQRSYLLKSTAKEMGYEAKDSEYLQHSLFGGNDTGVCKHDVFTLYLTSVDGSYNCNFKVLSQPVICDSVPPVAYNFCEKELLASNIPIIDNNKGPIEVLIGADVAGKLMTGGYKTLLCGLSAIETKLGWTLMGRMEKTASEERNTLLMVTSLLSLNASVSALWSLDTLGITDPSEQKTKTELHESAKKHFLETVRVENNRFIVHLPWLEDHSPLDDNYNLALKRLNTTVKRLKAQSLYEEYEEVFHSWLEEKIIEKVHDNSKMSVHYLPHRPVIKENSTTRIRPVFDASAKNKGSPSLNDCLEKGENLIELIPNILTRFRREKIGVIGDIRKAFLQISIIPDDRDYLRFLWYSSDGDIIQYRHCRVVFGVSCSPFLLGSTIQYHLQTVLEKIRSGD